MTSPENQKQQNTKNGCIGCLAVILFIIFGAISCSVLFPAKKQTEAEKVNEWYQGAFFYTCIRSLKGQLRDPESYKDNGEYSTSEDTGNQKTITWNFRSKNGFGGYNASSAICNVSKENGGSGSASIVGE
jgi:hypothetical protein